MGVLEHVRRVDKGTDVSVYRQPASVQLVAEIKQQVIERVGFEQAAQIVRNMGTQQARQELQPAVETVLNESGLLLGTEAARMQVIRRVLDDIVGLGPLQPLLEDDSVTEIMINGCSSCFCEQHGVIKPLGALFTSDEQIMIIIDRIVSPLGRRIDERSPVVNARLKNGYRVNAVIPPIAIDGPTLTIRKFSSRLNSLSELVRLGSIPQWYAQLLSWAVICREDLAVAGGTGSGKTTLLNALSCEINPAERIVTIEDSAELQFSAHPHVVRLEAREASIEGAGRISIRDLVANALRMRPDRIVVGEVRGSECIDMLQAMNTGHDGSLTTLHAGTAEETIARMILLARFGIDLPSSLIEEQISTALDGIVMTVRSSKGQRFVSTYSQISRASDGKALLEQCVGFDIYEQSWTLLQEPRFIQRACNDGLLNVGDVECWRQLVVHSQQH